MNPVEPHSLDDALVHHNRVGRLGDLSRQACYYWISPTVWFDMFPQMIMEVLSWHIDSNVAVYFARNLGCLWILTLWQMSGPLFSFWAVQQSTLQSRTIAKMNSLSFDDSSLDNLDPTLPLNDASDIDTALLSDIDGRNWYQLFVIPYLMFVGEKKGLPTFKHFAKHTCTSCSAFLQHCRSYFASNIKVVIYVWIH